MTKSIPKIVCALIAVIIASYVAITLPISEKGIPFTAQSLVVFICAAFMKPKEILITLTLYLFMGIAGMPVFAEGASGFAKFTGPSGGFLWGFIFSGLVISFSYKPFDRFFKVLGIMVIATIVLFLCGLSQLSFVFDIGRAIEYGLIPFWKMAFFKAFLAAGVVFFGNPIFNRDKKVRS